MSSHFDDSLPPNSYLVLRNKAQGAVIAVGDDGSLGARLATDFDVQTQWRLMKSKDHPDSIILKARNNRGYLAGASGSILSLVSDSEAGADGNLNVLWKSSASDSVQASNDPPVLIDPAALASVRLSHGDRYLTIETVQNGYQPALRSIPGRNIIDPQPFRFEWTFELYEDDNRFSLAFTGETLSTISRTWSSKMYVKQTVSNDDAFHWLDSKSANGALSAVCAVDIGSNVIAFGIPSADPTSIWYGSIVKNVPQWTQLHLDTAGAIQPSAFRCISSNMHQIFVTDVHGGAYFTDFNTRARSQPWVKLAPLEQNPERPGWHKPTPRPGILTALQPGYAIREISSYKESPFCSIVDRLGYVWYKDISNRASRWTMVTSSDDRDDSVVAIAQTLNGLYAMTDIGTLIHCNLSSQHLDNGVWKKVNWKILPDGFESLQTSIVSMSASKSGLALGSASGHLLVSYFDTNLTQISVDFCVVPAPPVETMLTPYDASTAFPAVLIIGSVLVAVLTVMIAMNDHASVGPPPIPVPASVVTPKRVS